MDNKKIIANFELILMIVSSFAFAHMMHMNNPTFENFEDKYENAKKSQLENLQIKNLQLKQS